MSQVAQPYVFQPGTSEQRWMGETSTDFLATGAFVHAPAGGIHGFRVDSDQARYLILTTPRHAEFYRAITSPVAGTPGDGAVIEAACREYGIQFVGRLPD